MRVLDINTASLEELSLLRGIGKVRARRIVANRPYDEPYDLVSRGVFGENAYERIASLLVVSSNPIARRTSGRTGGQAAPHGRR